LIGQNRRAPFPLVSIFFQGKKAKGVRMNSFHSFNPEPCEREGDRPPCDLPTALGRRGQSASPISGITFPLVTSGGLHTVTATGAVLLPSLAAPFPIGEGQVERT
jgi:hypothetical protein